MNRETLQNEMEQVVAYLGQLKELWEQEIGIPLPPSVGEASDRLSIRTDDKLLDALHVTQANGFPIEAKEVARILETLRAHVDFMDTVAQMRTSQKSYFKSKNQKVLVRSKMLEEQVDQVINDYKNPKLL